ncbi:DUF7344 domain-containing protein [Haloarcula amylovorans]|uniref:DUF7344 domain-containing protein n=1 Tax=Haloarcula amylovorans TaxID=2562280 RepID=UPI001075F191|nr:hypothetical protein [Halomicroarcula amylolytica]
MAAQRSESGPDELPETVVSDLLSADSCRVALSILDEHGEPMVVEDLATAVVAARDDVAESGVTDDDRAAVCEELYDEHIPKLMATGVLSYDSMLGTVTLLRRGLVGRGRA